MDLRPLLVVVVVQAWPVVERCLDQSWVEEVALVVEGDVASDVADVVHAREAGSAVEEQEQAALATFHLGVLLSLPRHPSAPPLVVLVIVVFVWFLP